MGEEPCRLRGASAMRYAALFIADPVRAMMCLSARAGSLVEIGPLWPFGSRHRHTKLRRYVLAAGPEYNEQVLGDTQTFRTSGLLLKGPHASAQRRIRNGLVSMNGKQHAHYRKLLLPALRRDQIDTMEIPIAEAVANEIRAWPVEVAIDLWPRIQRLAQSVAIKMLFSANAGAFEEQAFLAAATINKHIRMNGDVGVRACPINIGGLPYAHMIRNAEQVEAYLGAWVRSRPCLSDRNDLLSIILKSPDELGQPPTDALLASHAFTLFGASYETCQSALAWTLLLLAQHPQAAIMLVDEVGSFEAGSSGEGIEECKWLDAVVKESMRLLPPVPYQMREAVHSTQLGGLQLPSRTRIILSSLLTNRLSALYPDADTFRPDRWSAIRPSQYEYLVFSAGPRTCIGMRFALLFLKIAVATILRRFQIIIVPGARIDYKVSVTMSPSRGLPAILAPQEGRFHRSPVSGRLAELVRF